MAKIFLVKFNGACSWEKYAVCKKTLFGRIYRSKYNDIWYSDMGQVDMWCKTDKESAERTFERITGKKLEDTY